MNTFPIKERQNKERFLFHSASEYTQVDSYDLRLSGIFTANTQCLTKTPCLAVLCPKTFLVGQVALMSTKSQNQWPVLTTQHCGWAGWDLARLGTAGSRTGRLRTGTEPAVWTISRPELSGNKSTEAAGWTSISTIFCRTYGPLEYPGRLPGLL